MNGKIIKLIMKEFSIDQMALFYYKIKDEKNAFYLATHGEFSWKNARKGVHEYENSSAKISIDDIRKDAIDMREIRRMPSKTSFFE